MRNLVVFLLILSGFTVDAAERLSDALEVGEYKLLYHSKYLYDHAVSYDTINRKWHMYGIPAGHKSFIHLTSSSLTNSPWTREEDFRYKGRDIWAPYIVNHDSKYWMFFTAIGNPRQIALSTTDDLNSNKWTHYSGNPILAHRPSKGVNGKNKDCMILRNNDQWIMYYSMVSGKIKKRDYWVVGYSTSSDLLTWTKPKVAFDEKPPSDPGVESPFVVKRGKYYYLFLSARPWPHGGVEVFRSENPFHWDPKTDFIKRFPKSTKAHAMEIIQDLDGRWYMTRCGTDGWWIAPMTWNDGQEPSKKGSE